MQTGSLSRHVLIRFKFSFLNMRKICPNVLLYSWKFWWGIKFGSLAVYITTAKLKSAKISYSHIIRVAIPYRTAKLKSANILIIAILGSTAKFNSRQYFISGYTVYYTFEFLRVAACDDGKGSHCACTFKMVVINFDLFTKELSS